MKKKKKTTYCTHEDIQFIFTEEDETNELFFTYPRRVRNGTQYSLFIFIIIIILFLMKGP
jgi:hypothetical protein